MRNILARGLVALLMSVSCQHPCFAAPKLATDDVVKKIQAHYDQTKTFSADFTQNYTMKLFKKTNTSKGKILLKHPGMMRWDYQAPQPKSFIIYETTLWMVKTDENEALKDACFKSDGLTASISFLWGKGNIKKEFNVSAMPSSKNGDYALKLKPKQNNSIFDHLLVVADAKTFRIHASTVVDAQGNHNEFVFTNMKWNTAIGNDVFKFVPSKGMHVSAVPGSCKVNAGP